MNKDFIKAYLQHKERFIEVEVLEIQDLQNAPGCVMVHFNHTQANGDLANPVFTSRYERALISPNNAIAFLYTLITEQTGAPS